MFPESYVRAVSEADYSGDSKTGGLIKISAIFRPPPANMDAFFLRKEEIDHRWGIFFGLRNIIVFHDFDVLV